MPKVTVSDGAKINYYVDDYTPPWDASETIVLCHGTGSNGRIGLLVAGHLSTKYRVIRIDERGMGESSLPPGADYAPSLDRYAEDVLNVIDALGIPKIYWFGIFSGGWIGMQFSVKYPDRIKALITCTCPSVSPTEHYSTIMKGGREGGKAMAVSVDSWVAPEMIEWEMNERAKNPQEIVAARWKFGLFTTGECGYDLWELMPKVTVPTLMITGSDCNRVPPSMVLEMAKQISACQVSVIENAGCCSFYTAPKRVAEATLNFLSKLPKR